MWQEYDITENDIELFRNLIPDYCIEPLKDGSLSGFAVINRDSGTRALVGVVLYRFINGSVEIEWVCPTEDYDLPDYGADMVRMVVNKARILGDIRSVYARFREGGQMAEYFPESEYTLRTETTGVFRFRLSDVRELDNNHGGDRQKNCVPLSDADSKLINSIISGIANEPQIMPLSHPVKWYTYEQAVSAIYRRESEAEGLILVEKKEDELVLSFLYSKNPVAGMMLLKHAFKIATERYGQDREVACPVLNDLSERLVKKIVPGNKPPEVICAEVILPAGTGLLEDFIVYHPTKKHAVDMHGI